jgi:hypothetical protein
MDNDPLEHEYLNTSDMDSYEDCDDVDDDHVDEMGDKDQDMNNSTDNNNDIKNSSLKTKNKSMADDLDDPNNLSFNNSAYKLSIPVIANIHAILSNSSS